MKIGFKFLLVCCKNQLIFVQITEISLINYGNFRAVLKQSLLLSYQIGRKFDYHNLAVVSYIIERNYFEIFLKSCDLSKIMFDIWLLFNLWSYYQWNETSDLLMNGGIFINDQQRRPLSSQTDSPLHTENT